VKLAESKRFFVFNEAYNAIGAVGIGDPNIDTFIVNAHAGTQIGTGDLNFIGNEILDPFHVLRLSVQVNYGTLLGEVGAVPTLVVSAYFIAVNEQFPNTVTPRITSGVEDTTLFVRHPDGNFRWQFNSQNVTIIKKKTIRMSGREITSVAGGTTVDTRTMKLKVRLRGKKQYEQAVSTGGVLTTSEYLKGWNYYWVVVSALTNTATAATPANPIRISGDRYLYFKDF